MNAVPPSFAKRFVCAFLALWTVGVDIRADRDKIENKPAIHTTKTENAVVTVAIESNCTAAHCPVRIEIKNIGSVILNIVNWGDEAFSCKLKLTDHQGRACPYTRYGAGTMPGRTGSIRNAPIGWAAPLKLEIPLEKYFVLTPGEWFLECVVPLDDRINDLTVDVPPFSFSIPNHAGNEK